MTRRFLLVAIATIGVLTYTATADAAGPTLERDLALASQAWPDSPCAGRIHIVWWTDQQADHPTPAQLLRPDLTKVDDSFDEFALGVLFYQDGRVEHRSCDLAVRRSLMAKDPGWMCDVIVHGAGHLDGRQHTHDGSVMQVGSHYPACWSLRDRIRHDMALLVPDTDPFVVCRPWEGRVLPCRVEFTDARTRAHVVWFRARVRGERYAIQRVRAPR